MRLRLISTKALGTTDSTSDFPSARMRASRGATTDVLPAPYNTHIIHIYTITKSCTQENVSYKDTSTHIMYHILFTDA